MGVIKIIKLAPPQILKIFIEPFSIMLRMLHLLQLVRTVLYSISIIALISLANSNYLDVFTIANRFDPFASVRPTRVTVLLCGVKE
jgi:hypothetical protein